MEDDRSMSTFKRLYNFKSKVSNLIAVSTGNE